ncbi:MAG: hypothetical protein OXC71_06770 [Chloroflexi bacterium]|nr:hypothetical protein [Chloroflexota bacterium]
MDGHNAGEGKRKIMARLRAGVGCFDDAIDQLVNGYTGVIRSKRGHSAGTAL